MQRLNIFDDHGVFTYIQHQGKLYPVYKNSTVAQRVSLVRTSEYDTLRFTIDILTNDIYLFQSDNIHPRLYQQPKFEPVMRGKYGTENYNLLSGFGVYDKRTDVIDVELCDELECLINHHDAHKHLLYHDYSFVAYIKLKEYLMRFLV